MKKANILAIVLIGLLVFAAALPAFARRTEKAREDVVIQRIADPILDNILNGFKKDDYTLYSQDFDPDLKLLGARSKFYEISRQMKSELGNYVSRIYMGSLKKKKMTIVLWKGVFEKSSNDILIKLVLEKKGKQHFVSGLWLQ